MSTVETRPVGRPCSVCSMPEGERQELELALLEGATYLSVSREHPTVDRNAVRRHVQSGHLPEGANGPVELVGAFDRVSLLERVYEVHQRAQEVAEDALQRGHAATVLRAGDASLRALSALAAMGVAHEAQITDLKTFKANQYAVRQVVARYPKVGLAVAHELEKIGRSGEAESMRRFVSQNEKEIEQ